MKKLIAILILCASGAFAADRITLFISVTNTPVTGDTLTINGTTRTWTNAHSALTILTNLASFPTNHSTTNLYFNLGAYQITERPIVLYSSSNQLRLIFKEDVAVSASGSGDWASFTYQTNELTTTYTVRVPYTVEANTNQTNIASSLLDYIEDKATNSFVGGSTAMTNIAFLAAANVFTGTNSFTQSFMDMPTLTNVLDFTGIIGIATNGYWTNGILDSPIFTNAFSYGGFSSPGAGANSQMIGTGAGADGSGAVALGVNASADGVSSIAIGNTALADANHDVVIGTAAEGGFGSGVVIGNGAAVNVTNAIAIGAGAIVAANDTNSVAIGVNATTTQTNQIMLGTSSLHVTIPGRLEVTGTVSNSVFTATNRFGVSGGPYANVQYRRYDLAGVANGANLIDHNGATYVKIADNPTAAFSVDKITGGQDGYFLVLTYAGGYTWTIANESGSGGGAAADRILTGTGADISMTNNPASATLIYDSADSRWHLLNHSN